MFLDIDLGNARFINRRLVVFAFVSTVRGRVDEAGDLVFV